mgnify:CR=1 FL=1
MNNTVIVLVVEDNEYYNSLLSRTLQKSGNILQMKHDCRVQIHSFTNAAECIRMIKSGELENNDIIAFVDYYIGNGITGGHIVRLLKNHNADTQVLLMSQSKAIGEREKNGQHDFFILKDGFAPAICRLYLEQFIDNKFS